MSDYPHPADFDLSTCPACTHLTGGVAAPVVDTVPLTSVDITRITDRVFNRRAGDVAA